LARVSRDAWPRPARRPSSGDVDPSKLTVLTEREREVHSALSVPLVSRDVLFGVLNVNAGAGRRYTEYDLQVVSLFAEQAAGAIRNARLYETERMHVARAELVREFGTMYEPDGSDAWRSRWAFMTRISRPATFPATVC
jgi:GAF domain-containing protein